MQDLSRMGVRILSTAELTREEKHYFGAYLAEEVAPRTDVIRADEVRNVKSEARYFASGKATPRHLIRMPDAVPRILEVPGRPGTYVRLGELLRLRPELFLSEHGSRMHELRAIRLANLRGEPVDWSELPAALEHRIDGRVTHLEVERNFPIFWRETIRLALGVREEEVLHVEPPLDKRLVSKLVEEGPQEARFPKIAAHRERRFELAPFRCIDRRDVLLHHPYQDYGAVEAFAAAAAADPEVTEIRSTLYRVGDHNVLARSLTAAAAAGKRVSVLLEGRARYGRLYSDFSLFTKSERLTRDAGAFFDALEAGTEPELAVMKTGPAIRELLVARLLGEGHPGGHAILKFNHLTDPALLDAVDACAARGGGSTSSSAPRSPACRRSSARGASWGASSSTPVWRHSSATARGRSGAGAPTGCRATSLDHLEELGGNAQRARSRFVLNHAARGAPSAPCTTSGTRPSWSDPCAR